ncbi:molybdopterin molybdotransferase MoeA [SAR202 cluster bacterium AD-804-J14_MRT_500m]|nr:molybdopterin molybdotransferase MoeA [SAR202 cluster bacterium AD-804-J14_MRT_500m]
MTKIHGHQEHYHADMLSVEDALERIIARFKPLEAEKKQVLETLGQVLAEDVTAPIKIPPTDNSAMDGYAVRNIDLDGVTKEKPIILQVIGTVAAGEVPETAVVPGTAIRIMTGATIPPGCDTVVPFELTDEVERKALGNNLDEIGIQTKEKINSNVRPAGEDVELGELVLKKGTVVRPSEIGVLASLGFTAVNVIRRPDVSILATGNELLAPGESQQPGKIFDSNSFGLAAAVQKHGGIPHVIGIARDNLADVRAKLKECLNADLILTSAGVSKGDYDVVKDVLAELGEMNFWSVRMRPAKPLAWGMLRGGHGRRIPHLGLPGNPVSAMVAFEEFARPAILKMLGKVRLARPTVEAVIQTPIFNYDSRRVFARVVVTKHDGVFHATPVGPQGSNILTSMTRANGLAICPEDVAQIRPGEIVKVKMIDWNEEVGF